MAAKIIHVERDHFGKVMAQEFMRLATNREVALATEIRVSAVIPFIAYDLHSAFTGILDRGVST